MRTACALLVLVASTSAFGQLIKYADWADGPVRHLMTKQEMKQWRDIHSDQDAQAFIELFWAKRDPTPDTARNEFREAFDARVALADQQFSGRIRGAMSDPGRAFILLGPPYTVSGRAGAPVISSLGPVGPRAPTDAQGNVLVPSPTREPNRQVWNYAHERKPKYIPQADFVLVFLDEGRNDWKLAYTERTNPDLILQEAVNGLIVSPNLTKAPFSSTAGVRTHATSFKDLLLETAYKQFRSGDKASVGPANLTWAEFVTPEGEYFVSAQLYASGGADIAPGQKVAFFTVVENAAGQLVEVDEDPTAMIANGGDAYVDKSLRLDPGTYTVTFGLGADGRVLSATRTAINVERLDPAATGISPLILSNNIYPLKDPAGPMDPFMFGALKVVPKGDSVFTTAGDLWYFVEVRNPGIADGAPKLQVKIDIEGKTSKGLAEMRFPLKDTEVAKLQGANRYALGLAIPLEGFIPGDYTIKIHIIDNVLGKNYDLAKKFRVRGL